MSSYRKAWVETAEEFGEGLQSASIRFDGGGTGTALVFERFSGRVSPGDEVVVNTTAVDLALGSGGYHFVLWNLERGSLECKSEGHIMKLRYTPLQFNVKAVEEGLEDLEPAEIGRVLEGMPVIAGSLHSQLLAAVLAYRKARPGSFLTYIMTDGGSLPASFSKTVGFLREKRLIDAVITCGQAFGGDLEAVNIYGALTAARKVVKADAAVALMGPGIVGTGSAVGFSGMEQAQTANAAGSLGGTPIIIPRIAFADERARHRGLSHHTVSVLTFGTQVRSMVALPLIDGEKMDLVRRQIDEAHINERHEIREIDSREALGMLEDCGFEVTVMGRAVSEEPEFFMAAYAAGILAAEIGA